MISFDVFDTLITRKTYSPRGVFLFMQKKMEKMQRYRDIYRDFAEVRYEAEQNAYKYYNNREVDLFDIYRIFVERLGINEDRINDLVNFELEAEIECVVPITENINTLKEKKEAGERVVLASDMYLNSNQIRSILVTVDRVFEDMIIYVSCECGGKKANGKLFSYIANAESVDYSEWTHYGDNIVSDHNIPNIYGINSVLVSRPSPSKLERSISAYFHENWDFDAQVFLGLVRQGYSKQYNYSYKLGMIYGGAVLFPYVSWILQRCCKEGLKKLLFMSRDGYILKKIADIIVQAENMDIKTDYVFVSKKVLRDNGEIGERAQKYLETKIGNCEQFAFVDFQGTGKSLVELSKRMNKKIRGFYYLLNGNPHKNNVSLLCYTYMPIRSGLIEIFCRAPHGAVCDYSFDDVNGFLPILEEIDDKIWDKCGLFDYISGTLTFAQEYLSFIETTEVEVDLLKIARYLIDYCENTPDEMTSRFIGEFPHDENNICEGAGYAPILKDDEIEAIYGIRKDEPLEKYYKGSNLEYSLIRAGKNLKEYLNELLNRIPVKEMGDDKTKFIIYAAGKFGYEARYRLEQNTNCAIVGWVDINYQKATNIGVEPVEIIKNRKFDYIMVCLNDKQQFLDVKNMLIEAGVNEKKIIWIKDYWKNFFI